MTAIPLNTNAMSSGLSAPASLCAHCSLPVPQGVVARGGDRLFCCPGCEVAFESIRACGLGDYHELRRRTQEALSAARGAGRAYAEFDDPAFLKTFATIDRATGGACIALTLEGLHCAACVWLIEKLPTVVPGLLRAELDLTRSAVRLTWSPERVKLSEIARTLDRFGYGAHPARGLKARDARKRDERALLARMAVAGAIAGNTMLLAFALYSGDFAGMQQEFRLAFRWISAALAVVALVWPGRTFVSNALLGLRTRTAHLDLPIAVGLVAGTIAGITNTVRGTGEVYFDSITVLIFVLLVGRWFNLRQQRLAADNLEVLFSLTSRSVRRVEGAGIREVSVESLEPGDIVEVRAGESIPADGLVERGESQVDESLLTGESSPIDVGAGSTVAAGSVNLSSIVRVEVKATGVDTRVGKLFALMSETVSRRAPVVRAADRIGARFVVGMIGLSLFTYLAWLPVDARLAFENASALLIVTCPCALGLSTPLALTLLMGRAAKRGILIKGGDAVESLVRPGVMLLDKTGTLTQGRQVLVRYIGDQAIRPLISALQSHSTHPLAKACVRAMGASKIEVTSVHQKTAAGIEGVMAGHRLSLGTRDYAAGRVAAIPAWATREAAVIAGEGLTPVWVVVDREVAAIMGFGDDLRSEAASMSRSLRDQGWRVGVLSGDHPAPVARAADAIRAEDTLVFASATPEQKLATVREFAGQGTTVMIGDGVNDAAALAAATVGIAVHGGAEASLESADVYLARPGLSPVVELLDGCKNTMRGIRICFIVSLGYNLAAASLAVLGVIHPLVAAILMPISSLTVLGIAHRTARFNASDDAVGANQGRPSCP